MPYIDTEILKRNIKVNFMPNVDTDGMVTVENAERYFLNLIEKTTIADVEEVKHGVWIEHPHFNYEGSYSGAHYECSECHYSDCYDNEEYRYCPHCGAKMDGEAEVGK